MTLWYQTCDISERKDMMNDICNMIREHKLSNFTIEHDIDDFDWALKQAVSSSSSRSSIAPWGVNRKILLNLNPPDRMKEHDAMNEERYSIFETDYK